MRRAGHSSLWDYRAFIANSIKRDFQAKYRQSLLGSAWAVLQPLAMILVYTVVFSQLMGPRLMGSDDPMAYSVYLCSGIFTWGLLTEITGRSQIIFLEHANLLKKLRFPWLSLPAIAVGNACLNFAIVFGLFTVFLCAVGRFPGWPYLAMLPLLVIQIALAAGLGVVLGVLSVFFRDIGPFYAIVLQFWFWMTPIVYPLNTLPPPVRDLILLNPMTPLVGGYQGILLHGAWPDWGSLVTATLVAMALCVLALYLLARRSGEMVDEL